MPNFSVAEPLARKLCLLHLDDLGREGLWKHITICQNAWGEGRPERKLGLPSCFVGGIGGNFTAGVDKVCHSPHHLLKPCCNEAQGTEGVSELVEGMRISQSRPCSCPTGRVFDC